MGARIMASSKHTEMKVLSFLLKPRLQEHVLIDLLINGSVRYAPREACLMEVWFTLFLPSRSTTERRYDHANMMRRLPLSAGCLVTVLIILCDVDQSSKQLEVLCRSKMYSTVFISIIHVYLLYRAAVPEKVVFSYLSLFVQLGILVKCPYHLAPQKLNHRMNHQMNHRMG